MSRCVSAGFDLIKTGKLSDDDLRVLNFDIEDRFLFPSQVSVASVVDIFQRFAESEPRYVQGLHYDGIAEFLTRNRLIPGHKNVSLAFQYLLGTGAISLPEPEKPEGVNPHGVNLRIERDPAAEARKRGERYRTEIVVTDPETGKGYTQYQLESHRFGNVSPPFTNPSRY